MREKIKEYWEERAKEFSATPAATTFDLQLRELEIATLVNTLNDITPSKAGKVLDVGCGDGYSTLKIARAIPGLSFLGVDYSESMIDSARKQLNAQPELKERVKFLVGDVTNLGEVCGESIYDVVSSDRCLINLDSTHSQAQACAEIAKHVKPGGYYVAIENFIEGHENMNEARRALGLPEIPIRWHNLYFKEDEVIRLTESFFEDLVFKDFSSSYYFATRVIYSAMCQMNGKVPDYNHEIHQLAVRLPWTGQFSPIRMIVLRRRRR